MCHAQVKKTTKGEKIQNGLHAVHNVVLRKRFLSIFLGGNNISYQFLGKKREQKIPS